MQHACIEQVFTRVAKSQLSTIKLVPSALATSQHHRATQFKKYRLLKRRLLATRCDISQRAAAIQPKIAARRYLVRKLYYSKFIITISGGIHVTRRPFNLISELTVIYDVKKNVVLSRSAPSVLRLRNYTYGLLR
jgi:hypothetical protein